MAGTGKLTRAVMFAALAALAGVIAFGAIAGAKKKPRKMPRGPYPALGCPVFPASERGAERPLRRRPDSLEPGRLPGAARP